MDGNVQSTRSGVSNLWLSQIPERILTEHVDPKCRAESRLELSSLYSVRNRSSFRDMDKILNPRYRGNQGLQHNRDAAKSGNGESGCVLVRECDRPSDIARRPAWGWRFDWRDSCKSNISFSRTNSNGTYTVDFKYKGPKVFGDSDQKSLVPGWAFFAF